MTQITVKMAQNSHVIPKNPDPASPIGFCLVMFSGLIAGLEKGIIPVHPPELKTIQLLLAREYNAQVQREGEVAKGMQYHPPVSPIKLEQMPLFPSMDSLQAVVDRAYGQLPDASQNVMFGLLMVYHNTLLKLLEQNTNFVPRKTYQD